MEQARTAGRIDVARIVVARPGPQDDAFIVPALERLGREVTLEVVHDALTCVDRCGAGRVDLVVADARLGEGCAALVEELAGVGPPVVVVCRGATDTQALAWMRRGAADCVQGVGDVGLEIAAACTRCLSRASADSASELGDVNHNIMQNMNSALLVIDAEGRIAFCNPPAAQILGQSADALHGQPVRDRFRGDEDDLLSRTLERGVRFKGAETLVWRPDGTVVPVGISCAPIVAAGGRRAGAVALFQDITEIKQLRSQALQTEKMASIGQLAAGVAHEINNPMGFIHANLFQIAEYVADLRRLWTQVEVLQKAVGGGDPEALRAAGSELGSVADEIDVAFVLTDLAKAVRESQEGSERIRHIVQDLRDFSHHDTGERTLADVNQCLDSTANIVWPMMKHVVVLEKDYADLPAVSCYPMQLKQVFMNLLVNAYQAIETAVGDSGDTGTIFLTTTTGDEGVVITVRDTGCGIAAEHRDRIFDPFFTTKKVGSGTGLGLSTSFSIVQRHGGTITVQSEPGEGTEFRLYLPLRAPEGSGVEA
jgi:PAS domain S-box-containing protein